MAIVHLCPGVIAQVRFFHVISQGEFHSVITRDRPEHVAEFTPELTFQGIQHAHRTQARFIRGSIDQLIPSFSLGKHKQRFTLLPLTNHRIELPMSEATARCNVFRADLNRFTKPGILSNDGFPFLLLAFAAVRQGLPG